MTEQEASKIRAGYSNGYDYAFGYGGRLDELLKDSEKRAEAERHAELLDDALKKQIPRKPVRDKRKARFTSIFSCPSCGGSFGGIGVAGYCYHCGQKLDWSEFYAYFGEGGEENETPSL